MKKAFVVAALFAIAGFTCAQNVETAPAALVASTAPANAAEANKAALAEVPAKVAKHRKAHAKKHVKAAAKKDDQAKADAPAPVAKADEAAPASAK